jgi:hypothetical protein
MELVPGAIARLVNAGLTDNIRNFFSVCDVV